MPALKDAALRRGIEHTALVTETYTFRATATSSELDAELRWLFDPVTTVGGGYTVTGGMALPHGESQLTVVAWVPEMFAHRLPAGLKS